MKLFHIGALLYVFWGCLHIGAAASGFRFSQSVKAGAVRARLQQNSWHLGTIAIATIFVAVTMNMHNSETGYWINLALVSATDIGFVLFILMPGKVAFVPGIIGPILWILAVIFSTFGFWFGL